MLSISRPSHYLFCVLTRAKFACSPLKCYVAYHGITELPLNGQTTVHVSIVAHVVIPIYSPCTLSACNKGYVAYRGVAELPLGSIGLPENTIRQIWGAGTRAGLYPLSPTTAYWYVLRGIHNFYCEMIVYGIRDVDCFVNCLIRRVESDPLSSLQIVILAL